MAEPDRLELAGVYELLDLQLRLLLGLAPGLIRGLLGLVFASKQLLGSPLSDLAEAVEPRLEPLLLSQFAGAVLLLRDNDREPPVDKTDTGGDEVELEVTGHSVEHLVHLEADDTSLLHGHVDGLVQVHHAVVGLAVRLRGEAGLEPLDLSV
ncbi:MAG: hypothetical protein BWY86_00283 [Candidatus Aminicenantes bacterium ADurb.Bin508]|nr:MAG: hypothetical protein BWY86_00283 [Candidatus Aminicenantes bacterium ADurb.Bin508]